MLKQREVDMVQASISRASQPSKSAAAENTHTQSNVQPVASTSSKGAFAAGPSQPSSWLVEADLTDSSRLSHKTNVSETPQAAESVAPPPTSLMDEQSLKRKHEDTGVSQRQDKRAKPVSIAVRCSSCVIRYSPLNYPSVIDAAVPVFCASSQSMPGIAPNASATSRSVARARYPTATGMTGWASVDVSSPAPYGAPLLSCGLRR